MTALCFNVKLSLEMYYDRTKQILKSVNRIVLFSIIIKAEFSALHRSLLATQFWLYSLFSSLPLIHHISIHSLCISIFSHLLPCLLYYFHVYPSFLFCHVSPSVFPLPSLFLRLRLARMNEEMREAEAPLGQPGQYPSSSPTEQQYRKCIQEFICLTIEEC